MALINCPECGRQVSDKALTCPNCGYLIATHLKSAEIQEHNDISVNTKKNKLSKPLIAGMILIVIILLSMILVLFSRFRAEKKENILHQTENLIFEIEQNISEMEDGYEEKVVLFGIDGTLVYSNTLQGLSDYTNTATWNPKFGRNSDGIYEKLVTIYGEPDENGGSHWRWDDRNGQYRIVLQRGELGMRLVIQKN